MPIPTEAVGSQPRPMKLQEPYEAYDQGQIDFDGLQAEQDKAAEDSVHRLEQTGELYVDAGPGSRDCGAGQGPAGDGRQVLIPRCEARHAAECRADATLH